MNSPNQSLGRVRVKICGVTNAEDAEQAIAAGADALGFNLFPGSRRYLDLQSAASWITALPPFVARVAVLVNAPLEEARQIAAHPAFDLVQFHGDEDADYCAAFAETGHPFIKAVRLKDRSSFEQLHTFSTTRILLDACAGQAYGGTGTLIDLPLAAECARAYPELDLLLAGGLRVENVAEAVRQVQPFAVDVASGVEDAADSRRKDAAQIATFIAEATAHPRIRRADLSLGQM
ncbi:MAG TPA: phosphoribosylanthranilate isomerase [Chthoniobacteraceae bacterium]